MIRLPFTLALLCITHSVNNWKHLTFATFLFILRKVRSCILHVRLCSIEITFDFVSRDDWTISNLLLFFTAVFKKAIIPQASQQREDWAAFMRLQGFISGILVHKHVVYGEICANLVPRVLWLFGQRMGASRDSGVLEFCYRKISAVKQWKSLLGSQSKNLNFFEFPRVSTGAHPLTKKPEDSGYEIGYVQQQSRTQSLYWVFGQRVGASRDSGVLEFCYRKISAVKQMEVVAGQPIKKFKFFRIPQSLYWRPSADQKARGLWVRDWICAATISYPESSGFLVSGWAPVETLGYWNFVTARFLR